MKNKGKKTVRPSSKGFFGLSLGILFLLFAGTALYMASVKHEIDERLEQLKSSRSSQFFAVFPPLKVNQAFLPSQIKTRLDDQGYQEKKNSEDLLPREYSWESAPPGSRLLV